MEPFRASRQANAACKNAIEEAVSAQWDGWTLPDTCAKEVLHTFGTERVSYVLANTLQYKSHDERFSQANRDWSKTVPMHIPEEQRDYCLIETHPAKLDFFVTAARREMERQRKPSIRRQLSQAPVHGGKPAGKTRAQEAR